MIIWGKLDESVAEFNLIGQVSIKLIKAFEAESEYPICFSNKKYGAAQVKLGFALS